MTTQKITKMAIVTALYVALTYVFFFMSYGGIQFRIAEILVLLVFYRKDYAIPLILGCAIANAFSTLGLIDVLFGTVGTVFAVLGIMLVSHFKKWFKREWIALLAASLFPVIANALLVGWEINIVYGDPFWFTAFTVAVGEVTVVSLLGVLSFSLLQKNKTFTRLITSDRPLKSYDGQDE